MELVREGKYFEVEEEEEKEEEEEGVGGGWVGCGN